MTLRSTRPEGSTTTFSGRMTRSTASPDAIPAPLGTVTTWPDAIVTRVNAPSIEFTRPLTELVKPMKSETKRLRGHS